MKFDNQHQKHCRLIACREDHAARTCYVSVDDWPPAGRDGDTQSSTSDGTQSITHRTCLGHALPLSLQKHFPGRVKMVWRTMVGKWMVENVDVHETVSCPKPAWGWFASRLKTINSFSFTLSVKPEPPARALSNNNVSCSHISWHLILSNGFHRLHECNRHTYWHTDGRTDGGTTLP